MQFARPFYNLYAAITGNPGLPPTGAEIKLLYASFLSGNASTFEALLEQVLKNWSGKGYDYLSVGACTDNALSPIAARYATRHISSTIYVVYWQDEIVSLPEAGRPVHVEIATL